MIDFFSRLDKYMASNELNDNKLTIQTGISNGLIGKARKRGALSQDNISKLLHTYKDLNANWLFTGNGNMIISNTIEEKEESNGATTNIFKLKTDNDLGSQNIPLYNIEAAAGLVELFQSQADTNPIDTLSIPNLPKCDGAVFVTGDSMYPLLKSGDIVAYKQIEDFNNDIFWGEMYLISVEVAGEEYISVKYIQKSEKGEQYIKLVSQNQHHQPKNVKLKKVRAMALVKASVRINSMG
ncbi:S24 family peptidase [Tenacibaculum maritimum]|uniref:S24 family peptidase n=1 Tax=Tenacibaculum maritimum TaxID=107401 RepID=UPI003876F601